jgi:endonuclease/exonuclease/phosphatase family metal-dependent hydrolase
MRISSFNVESLFDRPIAMNGSDWDAHKQALEDYSEVNELLGQAAYSTADKARIVQLLTALGLDKSDDGHGLAILRQNRGHLVSRSGGQLTVTANGRGDWVGWVELKTEPVNETATLNTAQVIKDIGADVQAVVEAENRVSLRAFSDLMLANVGGLPFEHVMLIDGNDLRGIDVGVMTRPGFDIVGIRSHVDDTDAQGRIFSRDCVEYTIATSGGNELVLLVNHLKSKGYGTQAANNALRLRQATRVKAIYESLRAQGRDHIAICGDFNDHPAAAPVAPLLDPATSDLRDISAHSSFADGGRPGTFGNCGKTEKFDYILLSPALFGLVTGGSVYRMGAWGGTAGTLWPHYANMARQVQAASDHCAVYADLNF